MEIDAPSHLATLGHPQRLAIFRLLMRRFPDRVAAGELAQTLSLKSSTLSAYLAALSQAGLITQERVGTSLRYAINMPEVRATLGYLFLDCCRGRPDLCAPATAPGPAQGTPEGPYNVLFICTGNSARSIFAEALLRREGAGRFNVYSAGTQPSARPNPYALEVLSQDQHDISHLRSKHIAELQTAAAPPFDFVFTVCNQAANEDCPAWPGQPVSAHWGLPDPVAATGTEAEKSLAFRQTYAALQNRIRAFTALPLASLDRISLQNAVDEIGRTTPGHPT
ncbi:helix-turn-helix domain-containing protein [Vannielia sp.]|uniref:arsenate reductase/protein-tyrosine-phosphatase family protein n=1 Tax=Vannielia sp. TaxID=2813045 RepID=UPI0026091D16|nr:helix-turn-helix domain-containing protein [Vannielia sp.]MDF1871746.1 helix-turn-helix domain-containing protein [Vannielia sp.]